MDSYEEDRYDDSIYREIISTYKDNKNVAIDENFDYDVSDTRRPIYMVRGKSITRDQVIEILSREEPLFDGWGSGDSGIFDERGGRDILKNCFYRSGYSWLSTFLFSDGTIGGNILEFKYPDPDEILPKWIEFGLKYDFLDMAVGYTDQDEGMCYHCRNAHNKYFNEATSCNFCREERGKICERKTCCDLEDCNKLKDLLLKYRDVDEELIKTPCAYEYLYAHHFSTRISHVNLVHRVKQAIVISDGKVHVLFGDNAVKAFKRYYDKYNEDSLVAMYDGRVFDSSDWHIFGKDFIKECFRYRNLSKKCYDIAVEKGFINMIHDDAKVVTADFIREEHAKMTKKYGLNGVVV